MGESGLRTVDLLIAVVARSAGPARLTRPRKQTRTLELLLKVEQNDSVGTKNCNYFF